MEALGAVFSLSCRLLVRSKKTIFMGLLALLPVAASALAAAAVRLRFGEGAPTGFGAASQVMTLIYMQVLLLAITLFYATALIGDEIDEKTITYLFVRPVPRSTIYLGKFLSCLLVAACLILPSAAFSFAILSSVDVPEEVRAHAWILAQDVAILALGTAAYSALFGFLGVVLKRPLLVGLLFCLGWESVVTYIPGYIHRFTVMHYLQSLLPHPSGQRGLLQIFQQTTSAPVAIVTLLGIASGFLALSCWAVSRKQYVLEA